MTGQQFPLTTTIEVTDGITTVTDVQEIDITSGATVTDAGNGIAQLAIAGGGGGADLTAVWAAITTAAVGG